MKYRFAVEVEFPLAEMTQEQTGEVLVIALHEGLKTIGHSLGQSVHVSVEKMRARSVDLDKSVEGNLE